MMMDAVVKVEVRQPAVRSVCLRVFSIAVSSPGDEERLGKTAESIKSAHDQVCGNVQGGVD